MKAFAATVLALLLAACASVPPQPSQRLLDYRAHAGQAVSGFHYYGRIDGWESLDDRTLAVWTRPREAWLLELGAPCTGLQYAIAIGLTAQAGQVYAGFDKVLVDGPGAIAAPCVIQRIYPLDVAAIRRDQQARRAQPPAGT